MKKINLELSTQEINTILQGLYVQRSKKIGLNNLGTPESSLSLEDIDKLIGKFGRRVYSKEIQMSLYNKKGTHFDLLVKVPKDPSTDPTYSYKFPTLIGGQVVEKWARKVRPINDLTKYLQGCSLKRYVDYMVDFNTSTLNYEYWFNDPQYQLMFSLYVGGMKQSTKGKGYAFSISCPHCQAKIKRPDIEWDL
jgi:hypothetical protein